MQALNATFDIFNHHDVYRVYFRLGAVPMVEVQKASAGIDAKNPIKYYPEDFDLGERPTIETAEMFVRRYLNDTKV